jgi:HSP20 family protein
LPYNDASCSFNHCHEESSTVTRQADTLTEHLEDLRHGARTVRPPEDRFALSRGFREEMDCLFRDFDRRRGWLASMPWTDAFVSDIQVIEGGRRVIIRSELPGMKKRDVKVNLTDGRLTIEGEHVRGHEAKGEGNHGCRARRPPGTFRRAITLPHGVEPENVHATFGNGVLEVVLDGPAAEDPHRGKSTP